MALTMALIIRHFWFTAKAPNGGANREDTKDAKQNALRETYRFPVALAPGTAPSHRRPIAR